MKSHHSPHIFDVDEASFKEKVIEASAERPILVDFWADWCSPCRALAPHLERVIEEYGGKILLGKVEVDENMKLAGHYRLRGFPTVMLFHRGEALGHFTGAQPTHWIRSWVEEHAGSVL